ncbi:hypothetical protein Dform_01516 [Dehalogenimonas formicexedens]|uniref:Uncharacterized protein n=1 Tax=Dehalogenimonas formicexedens TaxID=1839801 RepID=A0A1P8F8R3_9CHLR|nr:hypothetical protein [Dehalogenimonas formicexedens]APV44838.1 hypothetical protein Dform_01516 [Dehalogenimonas formicexedens]
MKGNWEFDFTVRAGSPVVALSPGGSASIPITVEAQGQAQPVQLGVATDWGGAGIVAEVAPNVVPGSGAAMLHVVVSAATPPGSYMIGVQGTTTGTFKTSQATVTVVVTPKPTQDQPEDNDGGGGQEAAQGGQPSVAGKKSPAARPAYGKMSAASAHRGPAGFIMTLVMLGVFGFGLYYLNQQYNLIDTIFGSGTTQSTDPGGASTYTGTQTFTIYSQMGGSPMSNSGPASVQIDGAGDVLGPVLFGKITNGVFTGEAHTNDGASYPMTGTFSYGTLKAEYRSNSVSWVWTLHK